MYIKISHLYHWEIWIAISVSENCEKCVTLLALVQKLIADLNYVCSKIMEGKTTHKILFTDQTLHQ